MTHFNIIIVSSE